MTKEALYSKENLLGACEEACNRFQIALNQNPQVMKYLTDKRKLTPKTIGAYRIGYAPDSWHFLSNDTFIQETGIPYNCLIESGLVIETQEEEGIRRWDRFRGRITIPIMDRNGKVVSFTARTLDSNNPVKYINGPETPIYSKGQILFGLNFARRAIYKSGRVIIVEGAIDQIQMHQHGFGNVVSPCGTALTEHHLKLLTGNDRTLEKILLFDGDTAGIDAAERVVESNLGHNLKVALISEKGDPDDVLRTPGGKDRLNFYLSSNSIEGGLSFLFWKKVKDWFEDKPPTTPEEKRILLHHLTPALSTLSADSRGVYYTELGKLINLPAEVIDESVSGERVLVSPSSGNYIFWQNQFVRALVEILRQNENGTLDSIVAMHKDLKVRELLTSPTARAVYDFVIKNHGANEFDLRGDDSLFKLHHEKGLCTAVSKETNHPLDENEILSLFNPQLIAYPSSKRRVNSKVLDDALSHLFIHSIARGLHKKREKEGVSLKRLSELRESIYDKTKEGEVHGARTN